MEGTVDQRSDESGCQRIDTGLPALDQDSNN